MGIISITTIVDPEAVLLKTLHMNHLDQGSKQIILHIKKLGSLSGIKYKKKSRSGKVLHNDCMIIVLESYDCIVGTDQPKLKYMY